MAAARAAVSRIAGAIVGRDANVNGWPVKGWGVVSEDWPVSEGMRGIGRPGAGQRQDQADCSGAVACSCGVPDCRELGWPHEWDPIAAGDSCSIIPPPAILTATLGDDGYERVRCWPPDHTPHRVTAPYERWGSGYACVPCIERFA
jgi:hypothetical protein